MEKTHEIDKMLQLLKRLIEERKSRIPDLQQRLGMSATDFVSLVYVLEYLGVVEVKNDVINMTGQSYSLLFEPLLVHEGTEQFVREIQDGMARFNDDNIKIPALLVPILLLRSLIPYFGLILRDIEKTEELELDNEKKEFLYDFFSLFKFDHSFSIKRWNRLSFTADEFYHLWFLVNRSLPEIIKTRSRYEVETTEKKEAEKIVTTNRLQELSVKKNSDKEKSRKSSPEIDDRFYNIPIESLKAFFEDKKEDKPKITHNNADYPMDNLVRLIKINIDTQRIVNSLEHYEQTRGQINLNVYRNGILKWDYFDERGKVPPLFLTCEGIYGDKSDIVQYSKRRVMRQSKYLQKLIERLG